MLCFCIELNNFSYFTTSVFFFASAAILLISEELEELLYLSDRVFVIYEGRIMGEVQTGDTEASSELIEKVGLMMTGTPAEQIRQGEVERHA